MDCLRHALHVAVYLDRDRAPLVLVQLPRDRAEWGQHADPLFSSYNPTPMTGAMRDSWFDDLVNRQGQLPYAIEDLERRLVGRLFLRHVRQREGTSVLGIDLDARYLGQGFGTDALRAFLAARVDVIWSRIGRPSARVRLLEATRHSRP